MNDEPPNTTTCGLELPPALRVLVEYMEGKVDVFKPPRMSWIASFSAHHLEDDRLQLNHRDDAPCPKDSRAALAELEAVAVKMAEEMLDRYPMDDE